MASFSERLRTAVSNPSTGFDYLKYLLWQNHAETSWGGKLWASSYSEFRTTRNLRLSAQELSVLELTNRHGHFIDVGAHVGIWTVPIALSRPAASVHSFEAGPATFAQLERNIAKNHLKNVTLTNAAIFDEVGSLTFEVPTNATVFGRVHRQENSRGRYNSTERVTVPSITIDHYCDDKKIDEIEFLKIDVEGAEWHVLKGCSRMLATKKVRYLWMELDERNQSDFAKSITGIAELIGGMGYSFYRFPDLNTPINIRQDKRDANMLAFAR